MKLPSLLCIYFNLCAILSSYAQQDPMYTKYIFNPLAYNPAYAGSSEALDLALLHRHQWWGIEGAPMTQSLVLHGLIPDKNIGLGMNLSYDRIAINRQFNAYGSFAYRLSLGSRRHRHRKNVKPTTHLFLGLQAGVSQWSADWTKLNYSSPQYDPAFDLTLQENKWLPNFGAGFYLQSKYWYVGFSSPMLVQHRLRSRNEAIEPFNIPIAQRYRHYYLSGGGIIRLDGEKEDFVLRPIVLIKNVGLFFAKNDADEPISAPTEFDLDICLIYKQMFWFGVAFRSAFELGPSSYDSVDFWFSVRLKNRLRIGVAYDLSLTKLRGPAQGTYEILVGYDLVRPPSVNQPEYRPYKYF